MLRQLLLYLGKRFAAAAATLLAVSFLVFSLLAASPGSEITTMLGARPASPELIAALKREHHLDDPFLVQYAHWLGSAARLDFGRSITTEARVTRLIGERVPISVQLAGFALALVLLIGVPAGFVA